MCKKVCFFSGDITRSGGTERVAAMIANGIVCRSGYEILVLSLAEQSEKLFFPLDKRIMHYALGSRWIQPGPGYAAFIPKLRRFLKAQDIDILVDIDIVLDVLSVPAAFGLKTKVISWEHFNYSYENSAGYRRMILHHVTPKTDYIITLTEGDRRAFFAHLKKHPPIRVIYNPMQDSGPPASDTEKKPWIVTTAALTRIKGMDYLLSAAKIVLKKYPDWKWLVLGEGEERGMLETQIRRHKLENRLILKGRVTDVNEYLAQAQIFVLASRREGLPMCLLEAKAQRLACVSFDIATGPDEIISDGCNGFLVPAFDCGGMAERIGQLIEDESLRQSFSKNAEKGMEKFQMDAVLGQWDEVFRQLCG